MYNVLINDVYLHFTKQLDVYLYSKLHVATVKTDNLNLYLLVYFLPFNILFCVLMHKEYCNDQQIHSFYSYNNELLILAFTGL